MQSRVRNKCHELTMTLDKDLSRTYTSTRCHKCEMQTRMCTKCHKLTMTLNQYLSRTYNSDHHVTNAHLCFEISKHQPAIVFFVISQTV